MSEEKGMKAWWHNGTKGRVAASCCLVIAVLNAMAIAALAATPPPASSPAPATAPAATSIEFLDNLANAQLIAQQNKKLIVAQFGATWCGWCHRMENQTFTDSKVIAQAGKFLWVKIDIDDHPDLAGTYHVRGVPHTVIMDSTGETLVEHIGFMPADEFVKLLTSGIETQAQRQISGDAKPDDMAAAITKLVEGLAKPERGGREQVLKAITSVGEESWPVLLKLMNDDRLAIRAAAAGALANATHSNISFDPFAGADRRREQIAVWQDWIAQHSVHDQA